MVKSLQNEWPLDLGKYYYTIDIEPGYEMEEEVFDVVSKSGDNLMVKDIMTGQTSADILNGIAMSD